ncbi:MAG: hypothetical protein KBA75_06365 [Alphaproteobacteria bacterium]|nr:hypothetical protein [Alphaproteobacteria bacterium]
MEFVKLLLDAGIIGLLGAGVYYALRLEKQLKILRLSQAEMGRYMADFARNIDRAEAGIKALKSTARESGDDLETLVARSRALCDELKFVTDHADSLVEKITALGGQLAGQARAPEPRAERPPLRAVPTAPMPEKAVVGEPRTRAERELLQALQQSDGEQAS